MSAEIHVEETGAQKYTLRVTYGEQTFECGTYISRAAALTAGRLFVARKDGEQRGRQKSARKKS